MTHNQPTIQQSFNYYRKNLARKQIKDAAGIGRDAWMVQWGVGMAQW